VKDYKVIPGKSVITQHRLMILEVWCSGKKGNVLVNKRITVRSGKLGGGNYQKTKKRS